jgi:hypothetical protein
MKILETAIGRIIYKFVVITAFFTVLFEVRPWYLTVICLVAICYTVAWIEGWRP